MKTCEENWDIAPYGHKHLWTVNQDGAPQGNCLKCGKPYITYSRQMIDAIIEAHELEIANQKRELEEA